MSEPATGQPPATTGLHGRRFWKLSGSGNDFVVFDVRDRPGEAAELGTAEVVRKLCARGTGVGADGVVLLDVPDEWTGGGAGEGEPELEPEPDPEQIDFRMVYYNADGSRGEMCGNAALCSTRLAAEELQMASPSGMRFLTDSGVVSSRMVGREPEIDLAPVREVRPSFETPLATGELRIGFALVGVPHLVILCEDVDAVDVRGRGAELRHHPSLTSGANVNFVSIDPGSGWRIRTFERGVEGETLACGTGAVAASLLLQSWNEAAFGPVKLKTRSGRVLTATPGDRSGDDRSGTREWRPSLRGSARIVFRGVLDEL